MDSQNLMFAMYRNRPSPPTSNFSSLYETTSFTLVPSRCFILREVQKAWSVLFSPRREVWTSTGSKLPLGIVFAQSERLVSVLLSSESVMRSPSSSAT